MGESALAARGKGVKEISHFSPILLRNLDFAIELLEPIKVRNTVQLSLDSGFWSPVVFYKKLRTLKHLLVYRAEGQIVT